MPPPTKLGAEVHIYRLGQTQVDILRSPIDCCSFGPPKKRQVTRLKQKKRTSSAKSGASYWQKRGVVFFSDVVFLCVEKSHARVPLDPRSLERFDVFGSVVNQNLKEEESDNGH